MCRSYKIANNTSSQSNIWLTADNRVIHPDAPAGGGGGGFFRQASPLVQASPDDDLPHPWSDSTTALDQLESRKKAEQLQSKTATPPQPAPKVTKGSTSTINGMSVKLKADASGVAGIEGALTEPEYSVNLGSYKTDDEGNIKSFVPASIAVVYQTKYGTGKPDDAAAYGRGTTSDDIKNGNITLGFHESCHRADILDYLTNTAPPTFAGKKGITEAEFKQAMSTFDTETTAYFDALTKNSLNNTDEVGKPTRTTWCGLPGNTC